MKKSIVFITTFITIGWIIESCSKSNPTGPTGGGGGGITFSCSGISPRFSADVQPIFNTVCSVSNTCHASGSTNIGGPFTNYAQVFAKTSNIRSAVLSGVMPQTGSLTQAQINSLICWIDSGAPNN